MILGKFTKQPADKKFYDIDYRPWLAEITDTLFFVEVTSIVCVDTPADTALTCEAIVVFAYGGVASSGIRVGKMIGGTAGQQYKLTGKATTMGSQVDEFELIFKIKDY
jgi:hypothetical protein